MVVFQSKMCLILVILMEILCSSHARYFIVRGNDGWTLHPLENYGHWAKRHCFQINDTLVFKYKKNHDSILVLSKDDFLKCNKDNPIQTLEEDDSFFKFKKSGPFFFVSGHNQNCEMGQKLIVVVISPYHHNKTHNAPSPMPETPLQPYFSHSPSPATHLSSPLVNPPSHYPSQSPSNIAPTTHSTPPSHPPSGPSPAAAKSPSHTVVPSHFPSPSPRANTPSSHPFEPPFYSPSPFPFVKNPIQPPSTSPSPSTVAKIPTHVPYLKPPSHSLSSTPPSITSTNEPFVDPPSHFPVSFPVAKAPIHPPTSHSPSASPITQHLPPLKIPKAESPKSNIDALGPELQHHNHSPAPQSYLATSPPHHAPAPTLIRVVPASGGSC